MLSLDSGSSVLRLKSTDTNSPKDFIVKYGRKLVVMEKFFLFLVFIDAIVTSLKMAEYSPAIKNEWKLALQIWQVLLLYIGKFSRYKIFTIQGESLYSRKKFSRVITVIIHFLFLMEIIRGKYFRVMISFAKSTKFLDLKIILIYGILYINVVSLLLSTGYCQFSIPL